MDIQRESVIRSIGELKTICDTEVEDFEKKLIYLKQSNPNQDIYDPNLHSMVAIKGNVKFRLDADESYNSGNQNDVSKDRKLDKNNHGRLSINFDCNNQIAASLDNSNHGKNNEKKDECL